MTINRKTITPAIASEMLKLNKRNRGVKWYHVHHLANEIRNGRWKFNGDTISMSNDRLIDGQHRLMAVVEAGMPIETIVVTGLQDDVFDTKDTGKRRTTADTLAVIGEKNCTLMAASLTLVDTYLSGRMGIKYNYSNQDIEALLKTHPGIRNSIPFGQETKQLMTPCTMTALHYLFTLKDRDLASTFFKSLVSGAGLNASDPIYMLRERLVANASSKAKVNREYIVAITIKAWNAKRDGGEIRQLKFAQTGDKPEVFPTIL